MPDERLIDFDEEWGDDEELVPVGFKLHGQHFECLTEAPATTLIDFYKLATIEPDAAGKVRVDPTVITGFLNDVLQPESKDRFWLMVKDPKTVVRLERLGQIVMRLAEVYTGRPTAPSSDSSDGQLPTDAGSQDGSPSRPALSALGG